MNSLISYCWLFLSLALGLQLSLVSAKETVVFVHGFAGFGPDELGPIQYWRFKREFPSFSFNVHEASVGPISSNWDRACELYAQIKGTVVDYGKAHSEKYGHERFGKDYRGKGFFPQWSPENRIHFVAHSMGGQTVRMLEALLQEGDKDEINAGASSALFTKQGNLIKSITAFSSPFDGTHLLDRLDIFGIKDLIQTMVLQFAAISSFTFFNVLYDFDLDHFGLGRRNKESILSNFNRIKESSLFDPDFEDIATFDLSPAGAAKNNKMGKQTYPDTYYFAFPTVKTFSDNNQACNLIHNGVFSMTVFLRPFAALLGSCDTPVEFRENDGIVPTHSAKCPKASYSNPSCEEFLGTSFTGNWQGLETNKWYFQPHSFDHVQIIGFTFNRNVRTIYRIHSNRLLGTSGFANLILPDEGSFDALLAENDEIAPVSVIMISIVAAATIVGAIFVYKYKKGRVTQNGLTFRQPRSGHNHGHRRGKPSPMNSSMYHTQSYGSKAPSCSHVTDHSSSRNHRNYVSGNKQPSQYSGGVYVQETRPPRVRRTKPSLPSFVSSTASSSASSKRGRPLQKPVSSSNPTYGVFKAI